MAIYSKQTLAR